MGKRRDLHGGARRRDEDLSFIRHYNYNGAMRVVQSSDSMSASVDPAYAIQPSIMHVDSPFTNMEQGADSGGFLGQKFLLKSLTINFGLFGRWWSSAAAGLGFNVPVRVIVGAIKVAHDGINLASYVRSNLLHRGEDGVSLEPSSVYQSHALDTFDIYYDETHVMPVTSTSMLLDGNILNRTSAMTLSKRVELEFEEPIEINVYPNLGPHLDSRIVSWEDEELDDPTLTSHVAKNCFFWAIIPLMFGYQDGIAYPFTTDTFDTRPTAVFVHDHLSKVEYFTK